MWKNLSLKRLFSTKRRKKSKNGSSNDDGIPKEPDLNYLLRVKLSDTKKERREKVRQSFKRNNVIMQVTKEDILMENEEHEDDPDLYHGTLIIPRTNNKCQVPNCCIICLESYQPGDSVVWSCNDTCPHAFHKSCIVKYLVKVQKRVGCTPCPCCRQSFTDLQVERRRERILVLRNGYYISFSSPFESLRDFRRRRQRRQRQRREQQQQQYQQQQRNQSRGR